MKQIYLSTYCVLFQDYAFLKRCVEQFPDFPVGIEFATYWPTPDFDRLLAAQIPAFAGRPATLHAPFVEICTEPGSPEEAFMELTFQKACALYPQFGASSMVMHTHEGSFPAVQADSRRARSTEVLQAWTERMLRQGISITAENVGYPGKDNVLFDEAQFVALFDRLPAGAGCLIDIGHAQADMVTKVYAHILDEDRKVNAQKFESALYANPDLRDVKPPAEQKTAIDLGALIEQLKQSPELAQALAGLIAG